MDLKALIEAVKEPGLTKTQLEAYSDELTKLFAMLHLELAELEKEEALYLTNFKLESGIATKRAWNVTQAGQRLIELDHYVKITEKLLSSVKHRIYSTY